MTTRRTRREAPGRMRDVSHAHRDHDPRAWHWFARGPRVAADGGRRDATEERDVEEETLGDVSHEPAHGDGANQVWERGDDAADDDEREA